MTMSIIELCAAIPPFCGPPYPTPAHRACAVACVKLDAGAHAPDTILAWVATFSTQELRAVMMHPRVKGGA